LLSPRNWFIVGDKMYIITAERRSFTESARVCLSYGASLAVISDDEENDKLTEAGASFNRQIQLKQKLIAFIGYYRKTKSLTSWSWIDSSEKSSYSNFSADTTLSDENKACAVLDFRDGSWKVIQCSYNTLYICEKGLEWHYFNTKRFIYTTRSHYYEEGEELCNKINSNLLTIDSQEENDFVQNFLEVDHSQNSENLLRYHYSHKTSKWYRDRAHTNQIVFDAFFSSGHRHPRDMNVNCTALVTGLFAKYRGTWIAKNCVTASRRVVCNG
ncbi:C-type mannose receptor 2-like, partial [Anneissia japonica]|uniref:C-type mannose receptor 2-like n=1 Tax=Anneissia japonica TaxID=1529436 RepID=UPI0014258D91